MEIINAIGMTCPLPVIEAKKAIAKLTNAGDIVQILVDNFIACENLKKMCDQKGYSYSMEKHSDRNYAVTITLCEGHSAELPKSSLLMNTASDERLVVAIGQDKMGGGDDNLGRILIKGFIYSLVNLDVPPKAVLFFNSGINLVLENSNTLDDLRSLEQKGTTIFVCGTCVDFYNCKNQVAVGEITNMYNIVENLRLARSIINI